MPLPLRGPFLSLSPPHHGAGGPTHAPSPDLGHNSHSIAQEGDGGHVITVEMEQAHMFFLADVSLSWHDFDVREF